MKARGGGAIVSTGSCTCTAALPEGAAYSASKGAPAQLTKVLAVEGGPLGIRANIVAAGVIETDFLDTIRSDSRAYLASFADAQPLGHAPASSQEPWSRLTAASPRSSAASGNVSVATRKRTKYVVRQELIHVAYVQRNKPAGPRGGDHRPHRPARRSPRRGRSTSRRCCRN
ncbi:hypothetical protein T261_8165 [Streptomyces lydicus]|nr:hypothetical protein T261_8165 [Streptomyces lydicus]